MATAEVERLRGTLQIARAELDQLSHTRELIAGFSALLVLVVVLIATVRVRSVYVEGDLTVSALSLRLAQPIADFGVDAEQLRAAGFDSVVSPSGLGLPGPELPLLLSASSADSSGLHIQQLTTGRGARLFLRQGRSRRVVSVAIEAAPLSPAELLFTGYGRARAQTRDTTLELDFGRGVPLAFHVAGDRLDLEATVLDTAALLLRDVLSDSLAFIETERLAADTLEFPTVRSDVISGRLTFPSLRGRSNELGSGTVLRISASRFHIHHVTRTPQGFRVSFAAQARSVRLGNGDVQRELKPIVLVWLFMHDTVGFIRATLLVGIPLLTALITTWVRR
jgi:hypothetical protein